MDRTIKNLEMSFPILESFYFGHVWCSTTAAARKQHMPLCLFRASQAVTQNIFKIMHPHKLLVLNWNLRKPKFRTNFLHKCINKRLQSKVQKPFHKATHFLSWKFDSSKKKMPNLYPIEIGWTNCTYLFPIPWIFQIIEITWPKSSLVFSYTGVIFRL